MSLVTRETAVLDAEAMTRAWTRVAHEIRERNAGSAVVLAGIPTRGVPLAHRLAAILERLDVASQVLDLPIDSHRDDRDSPRSGVAASGRASLDINSRVVVVVDDVIFHGRTARAALDALIDFGRPAAVQLAVLVDRGHRELPIRADFVGKNIPTHLTDRVQVRLLETDGQDAVVLQPGAGGTANG